MENQNNPQDTNQDARPETGANNYRSKNAAYQQPEPNQFIYKTPSFFERNKLLIKGAIVAILILCLLIPQIFIHDLVRERQSRQSDVEMQIAKTWGDSQTIAGPMIAIPYRKLMAGSDANNNKSYYTRAYTYIMPDVLQVESKVNPSSKRVSIFNVSIYDCTVKSTGKFKNIDWGKLNIATDDVYWSDAKLLIGISDYKGLMNQVSVNWNGKDYLAETGFEDKTILPVALQIPIPLSLTDLSAEHNFSFALSLRGTKSLNFIPSGNQTNVSLNTKWTTPRFSGNYPAVYNSDFNTKPLHATWNVLGINRNFPQQWKDQLFNLNDDAFGLSLIQPIDTYAKTMRSVKYALLVIALTFLVYFFIEVAQKKLAHPIQYVLVGFALTIFYLLLLSISEYTGFNAAYLISAFGTIGLISLYTGTVFGSKNIMLSFAGFLSLIYLFIFLLIQLEDGALLIGSIGLFIILSAVMYFSKKINWYPNAGI